MTLEAISFYLAGPINHENKLGYSWREELSKSLKEREATVYDPKEFEEGVDGYNGEDLVNLDKEYIQKCDVVIINFKGAHNNLSIGTPMEMMYAYERNKTIFTIGASDHIWVEEHTDASFETLEQFIKFFVNLDFENEELEEYEIQEN